MVPSSATPSSPPLVDTTWVFDTSEGAEFDALLFAAGKGSFYIKDTADPDQIVHEMLFVGLGLTKGKGPIPFSIGGSFSTPDMFSHGLGPIQTQNPSGILTLADFQGVHMGTIISAAGGVLYLGASISAVYFGLYSVIAQGIIVGHEYVPIGGGFTIMPVIFTIDP
jgi:hypothetical protein